MKHKGQLPYKLTFNERKRLASKGTNRHVKVLCGAMDEEEMPILYGVPLVVHAQRQRNDSLVAGRAGLQPETGHAWLTVGDGARKAGKGRACLLEARCEKQLQVRQGLEYTAHVRHCQKFIPSAGM